MFTKAKNYLLKSTYGFKLLITIAIFLSITFGLFNQKIDVQAALTISLANNTTTGNCNRTTAIRGTDINCRFPLTGSGDNTYNLPVGGIKISVQGGSMSDPCVVTGNGATGAQLECLRMPTTGSNYGIQNITSTPNVTEPISINIVKTLPIGTTGWDATYTIVGATKEGMHVPNGYFPQDAWFSIADRVPMNNQAINLSKDGKTIYTNAGWDEAGMEHAGYRTEDGRVIGRFEMTHSWGHSGGDAVTSNSKYVYFAHTFGVTGGTSQDVQRHKVTGQKAPFTLGYDYFKNLLKINEVTTLEADRSNVRGLASDDTYLYVGDLGTNKVKVYDAETMSFIREWSHDRPDEMVVDNNGKVWVIQSATATIPSKIIQYDNLGNKLKEITGVEKPVALGLSIDNKLYVADQGISNQVFIYDISGTPTQTGTFGVYKGIWEGSKPGLFGEKRFDKLTGVQLDIYNNIYISFTGNGKNQTTLEKYDSTGERVWTNSTLEFLSTADVDPTSDGTILYDNNYKFEMDYSKDPVGEMKEITKTNESGKGCPAESTWFRVVQGKKFVFCTGQYGDGPNGAKIMPDGTSQHFVNFSGDKLYQDRNNDGDIIDAGEVELTGVGKYGFASWVDEDGGLWVGQDDQAKKVHYIPATGLNLDGSLKYDKANLQSFSTDALATTCGIKHLGDGYLIKRLQYDAKEDVMWLSGQGGSETQLKWWSMGTQLCKIKNFKNGTPTKEFVIQTGFDSSRAFHVEGDFVFVVDGLADRVNTSETWFGSDSIGINVFNKNTGALVNTDGPIRATGNGADNQGWCDMTNCLNAHKRKNGEYMVMIEEVEFGRTVIHRLFPNKISNTVFHDKNKNGINDAGDTPIKDVKVEVLNSLNEVKAETLTDATGLFEVYIPAGTQNKLKFTLPNGSSLLPTTKSTIVNSSVTDSDINSTSLTDAFDITNTEVKYLSAGFVDPTGVLNPISAITLQNITKGACNPTSILEGTGTVTCDYPLTGNSGNNYQLPTTQITATVPGSTMSPACTLVDNLLPTAKLVCANIPITGAIAGIKQVPTSLGATIFDDLEIEPLSGTNISNKIPNSLDTPNIQGYLNPIYTSNAFTPVSKISGAPLTDANDLSAGFRTNWDSNNLYFYYEIKDDSINTPVPGNADSKDGVEVMLDLDNSKAGDYDGVDDCKFNFVADVTNLMAPIVYAGSKTNCNIAGVEYKTIKTTAGYNIEAKIPRSALGRTAPFVDNESIGFDSQINDNDNGTTRETILTGNNPNSGSIWNTPSTWGIMKLATAGTITSVEINKEAITGQSCSPISGLLGFSVTCKADFKSGYTGTISFSTNPDTGSCTTTGILATETTKSCTFNTTSTGSSIPVSMEVSGNVDAEPVVIVTQITVSNSQTMFQLKVILQGAWNATNNNMNNSLATKNLIPTNQPYNNSTFGYTGTETLSTATMPVDSVDWLLVQFRNTSGVIVASKAGLLKSNGILVNADGGAFTLPSSLVAGSYNIVVRHRNHLAISTATPITIATGSGAVNTLDFTSNVNVKGSNQGVIKAGVYGLKRGNANGNNSINSQDRVLIRSAGDALRAYSGNDINMDGSLLASDRSLARQLSDGSETL